MRGAIPGGRLRLALCAGVFLVALVPRLWGIGDRCVWMDEDRQAGYANDDVFAFDVVGKAALQQQPPLDYHLENISIRNFGFTPTGIRLNAALLGALAVLAFFLLASRVVDSRVVLAAATLMMTFHPLLVRYSQEARPISLSVLTAVLCVAAMIQFFSGKGGLGDRIRRALVLLAAQVALLLSVGLQPLAFLGTACIAVTPCLLVRRHRWRVFQFWGVSALALAIFAPLLIDTLERAAGLTSFAGSDAGILETVVSRWGKIRWGFAVWAHVNLFAPFLMLFAVAGGACVFRWARGEMGREAKLELASAALFCAVFPIVFAVLYYVGVQLYDKVPSRYYLTMIPPAILLFALVGDQAAKFLAELRSRSRSMGHAALLVALLSGVGWGVLGTAEELTVRLSDVRRDWRGLYELFSKEEEGGVAYTLNFVGPGQWSPRFWSKRFYYPEDHRPVRLRGARQLAGAYRRSRRFERNGAIYLVTVYGDVLIPDRALAGMPGVELHRLHRLAAIRVAGHAGSRDRIFGVLTRLHDSIEQTPRKQILSGLVFQLAKIREDRPWIEESCRSLMSMEGKGWVADLQIKCGKALGKSGAKPREDSRGRTNTP